jgi:hypothetical protein
MERKKAEWSAKGMQGLCVLLLLMISFTIPPSKTHT